jgi:transposase
MMRRFGLRDNQWERIRDLLPGREGSVGVTAADNRLFVEAVLYRYRTGMPWRDLPERFRDWKNVHRCFSRWAEAGVWEGIFQHLAADADNEPRDYDGQLYGARHVIENFFAKIKQFRAIATSYEKTARNFLAAVQLVASVVWLT